jgi:prepilin-type N-terminal cleavage/methylation domain-containing protein
MRNEAISFEAKNRREAGFSFIELMISLTIFAIFLTAIYGLLRIANIQKGTVNSQTEVVKNLRLSLNTLGRDAVNAGLGYDRIGGNMPDNLTNLRLGLPADTNAAQDLLTAVIAGNNINTNVFLPNPGRTDVVTFAFQDKTFNGGNPMTITDSAAFGGTGLTLSTAANGAANASQFDLYFISQGTRTGMALVTNKFNNNTLRVEIGDPLGINSPANGNANSRNRLRKCPIPQPIPEETDCMTFTGTTTATAKKIFWISYGVDNDGTLVRTTYGNNTGATAANQIQRQPIAYNIQNFQIRYLMRDGTTTDDPSVGGTIQGALNNVVQIEVKISSRVTVQENGVNTQKTVDLKSTFSTKNLNYDAS